MRTHTYTHAPCAHGRLRKTTPAAEEEQGKMKYKIVTYGCQMNVHESEKIAGLLEGMGAVACKEDESADIVVFNTCCIRDNAERRALGNIGVVKGEKKKNPSMIIAVVGCMTQQSGMADTIRSRYPYVDIVLGTRNIFALPEEIKKVLAARAAMKKRSDKRYRAFETDYAEDYLALDEAAPVARTSFPNAWVNIIYGCNNFCTYCIVPYVRGRELSRPMPAVLDEVRRAVDEGYREITLLGQNVNSYGHDLSSGESFERLLREMEKIDGKFRVRFMTSHPKDLTDGVIAAMAESTKVPHNIHLPVQSGSDKVLGDMNRRYTRERYFSLIEKLRAAMPDIGITTDVMVGFPTETEEDFLDTMDLVGRVRFSNAFTFIYSPRKGTPAAKMTQIPYPVKRARIGELIKLQNSITKELSEDYVGGVYEVLAEDVAPKHPGMLCGRTASGRLVTFPGDAGGVGEFFRVRINEARSASLFGKAEE